MQWADTVKYIYRCVCCSRSEGDTHISASPERYLSATRRILLWVWLKLTRRNCAWRSSSSSCSLVLGYKKEQEGIKKKTGFFLPKATQKPPILNEVWNKSLESVNLSGLTFSAIIWRNTSKTLSATQITHCIIPEVEGMEMQKSGRLRKKHYGCFRSCFNIKPFF